MRAKRNHYSASDKPIGAPTRLVQKTSSPTWCAKHDKRKYTSKAQALKASEQKHGAKSNAYQCPQCGSWHCTRRGTRLDESRAYERESDSSASRAADALVDALFGSSAGERAANDEGGVE